MSQSLLLVHGYSPAHGTSMEHLQHLRDQDFPLHQKAILNDGHSKHACLQLIQEPFFYCTLVVVRPIHQDQLEPAGPLYLRSTCVRIVRVTSIPEAIQAALEGWGSLPQTVELAQVAHDIKFLSHLVGDLPSFHQRLESAVTMFNESDCVLYAARAVEAARQRLLDTSQAWHNQL